jgi:hypothetical protein
MKILLWFSLICLFVSCVSSKKVAESRNSDFAAHNSFELFKIWRQIDILRFDYDILNVKIAVIPENKTIDAFKKDSQMISIYDSLQVIVSEKMDGFRELKESYFDTTEKAKLRIYQELKSDSLDKEFLDDISNSAYYELYEDILVRLRKSIQSSDFYSSQNSFEDYIQHRTIEIVNMNVVEDIVQSDQFSLKMLSEDYIGKFRDQHLDFIIAYSGSYNINYSDRARSHIGSENIRLILFDIHSADKSSEATITYFWGSE